MPNFYGQFGEDIYIYNNYINEMNPYGTYVELGAVDGVEYSITKFFEDELKFNGILIEPTPCFNDLIKNRPRNKCYRVAIHKESETEGIFMGTGCTSGLVDYMNDTIKNINGNSPLYYVKCCPFSEIQKETKIPYIDIFVLDVEGSEEIVLNTVDFSIPIYIFVIELDGINKEKDERCREILRNNGFDFDIRININEFWINKNYFRKDKLYTKNKPKFNLHSDNCHTPNIDRNHSAILELQTSLTK